MAGNKNNNKRKVHIPSDVKEFAKADFKKFKKRNKDYYDSKKELRKSFYLYLIDLFPSVIEFTVKYGYINDDDVQEVKHQILAKINDVEFIKVLKKTLKNDDIHNIKLLPIIIKEILMEAKKRNDAILAENPNGQIYDMSDLVELSRMILKKRMKKLEKLGISSTLAFDVLSVIPCKAALESSQSYRIRVLYETLYEHAKTEQIDFEKLIDAVIDEDYQLMCITFALLERKEKFSRLTDSQKTLYLAITNWCFNTMEKKLKKAEVAEVLNIYVRNRTRDDKNGKDSNRRYSLSSLSEEEYPRIAGIVKSMIADNDSVKKYL